MSARRTVASERGTLSIRIRPDERSLIDRAAKLQGKSCADFVLDAACAAAEEAVSSQTMIVAHPEAHAAVLARLDMPTEPNERLCRTMRTKAPWDEI